jgi:hypothetical protein
VEWEEKRICIITIILSTKKISAAGIWSKESRRKGVLAQAPGIRRAGMRKCSPALGVYFIIFCEKVVYFV